ncbi:hypothetical protein PHYBOEH_011856 [Phytophthora boehmeriae]|uniref:Complex 1 LYR protein domain-containing protein n=1 Tax=Phytophthora boehmeriae TaxID=109152 RepID=A0A8T1WYR5_9STRA|nr:hypothetical protein PHYBOEH_011856 [Phytophthora boehmeriae]
MKPHSGLQRQVLTLYKKALQAAKRKDSDTLVYVRERFREDAATVDRKDFVVIEYMLRKGERDLKMLERMKSAHFQRVLHQKETIIALETAMAKTFERRDAELEPEPEAEVASIAPPEEFSDEVWSTFELWLCDELSDVGAKEADDDPTEALADAEIPTDKLAEEDVDTEEEAANELPELDNDRTEPEAEDDDVRSGLANEPEPLVEASSDDTTEALEVSPAETDAEPELDESRAVVSEIATAMRRTE